MGKTNIALSQSNRDKVLCYKAGVYCKVVSQREVKVTLYGREHWQHLDLAIALYVTINQLMGACIRCNLTPTL